MARQIIKLVLPLLAAVCMLPAQASRPRIAVAGISHESNSFNTSKTRLEEFDLPKEQTSAEEFIRRNENQNTTVAGYIEGAKRFGLDLYPTVVVSATPKGPVTDNALNTLMAEILRQLKAAPKLDGVLLALHGAMVVESYPSGDAEIVRRVREAMGKDFPIIATHDFHANVTPDIVRDSNVLITYKENPHIDPKDRGIQAARIMAGMARGEMKPTQAIVKPPMNYNIVYQYTKRTPLLPIVNESRRLEEDSKFLAVSVSGGYQYADVEWMGPSVIVVTDNDPQLAQREAQRLSDMLWATREQLVLKLPDAARAVSDAMQADRFPVVLVDLGDNIGGGTPGDSTFILEELLRQKAQGWAMVIADPEATKKAFAAGVTGRFEAMVGGKTDDMHGKPVRVTGRVKSLHDGEYIETEIRHGGGRYWSMGLTAVVEVDGGTRDLPNLLLLTMERSSPNSAHQFISNGVYPERMRIVVVKGAIAPRAAYEPIAAKMVEVDTGGATAVNPKRFTYKHVRRPLFGID